MSQIEVQTSVSSDLGFDRIELTINGGTSLVSNNQNEVFTSIEVPVIESGTSMVISAIAYDIAGNSSAPATRSFVIQAESIPPTLDLIAPFEGVSLVAGSPLRIAANASDNKGIAQVEFVIQKGGATLQTHTLLEEPYSFVLDTANLATGIDYSVTATVVDVSGNTAPAQSVNWSVTADDTNPIVSIYSPVNGSVFEANSHQQVRVLASDDFEVDRVELKVDGATTWLQDEQYPYSFSIVVPELGDSDSATAFPVTARAFDTSGNVSDEFIVTLYSHRSTVGAGGESELTWYPNGSIQVSGDTLTLDTSIEQWLEANPGFEDVRFDWMASNGRTVCGRVSRGTLLCHVWQYR